LSAADVPGRISAVDLVPVGQSHRHHQYYIRHRDKNFTPRTSQPAPGDDSDRLSLSIRNQVLIRKALIAYCK
jgi:hypothetical protein